MNRVLTENANANANALQLLACQLERENCSMSHTRLSRRTPLSSRPPSATSGDSKWSKFRSDDSFSCAIFRYIYGPHMYIYIYVCMCVYECMQMLCSYKLEKAKETDIVLETLDSSGQESASLNENRLTFSLSVLSWLRFIYSLDDSFLERQKQERRNSTLATF